MFKWIKKIKHRSIIGLSVLAFAIGAMTFKPYIKNADDENYNKTVFVSKSLIIDFTGDTGLPDIAEETAKWMELHNNHHDIIDMGDLCYRPDGGENGDGFPDEESVDECLGRPYKNRNYILWGLFGNHGMYNLKNKHNVFTWVKKYSNIKIPNQFYLIKYPKNVCIYAIDTTSIVVKKNKLAKDQDKWLKRALKEKYCHYKILAGHHPYFSDEENHGNATGKMKEWYKKWAKEFDLLAGGHSHVLGWIVKDGHKQIISGAGAKLRFCKDKLQGFCLSELGFVRLHLETMELEFITENKTVFEVEL